MNDGEQTATQTQVIEELRRLFPESAGVELLRSRSVTQHHAVFSTLPGVEELRASQKTCISNLFLAGDWTRTGWPSTMEGAVRSGYLAAEALLKSIGVDEKIVIDDLPVGWLARRFIG